MIRNEENERLYFKNANNGCIIEIAHPFLWSFVFGVFYFAKHGAWLHTLLGVILVFVTLGVSWLIYPFFSRKIIEKSYLGRGWIRF